MTKSSRSFFDVDKFINYKKETFDLIAEEIKINKNCWLGAKSIIGPGVNLKENSILKLGSIVTKSNL